MYDRPPVLIVDAGGTLVTRTRPGLAGRVVRAARAVGDDRPEREVRAAVLTAANPDACLRALDPQSPAARAAVLAELTADPGDAMILPGAQELLRTAIDLGWRIIVASNAGPGTPPLPDELGRHVSSVVESRDYGLVKEDPRFWARLLEEEKVDVRVALVVGDNPVADGKAPEAAGIQSRLVCGDGVAREALTAQLRAAGSRPEQAAAVVAGHHERWAGRDVIVAPHLTALVTRVTRARLRFSAGPVTGTAVVVRRRALPPVVVAAGGPLPELAWLHQPPDRRPYQAPAELKERLEREGLSLDGLSQADRRHALSMIREARSSTAVSERMADLVLFLKGREKDGSK
ncbi:HAD family hydrolase [Streptomyces sp. CA-135486]|uniref:HAD family hydrolase n=1 Tax=Streptomyces sp. CA-135486 TaxID=3240049 RepID=UPI003D8C2976